MSTLCKSLSAHLSLPSRISQYSREGTTLELGRAGENKMTLLLEPLAPVGVRGKCPPCPHEVGEVSEPLIPTSIILGWVRWGRCYQTRDKELEGPSLPTPPHPPDPTEEGLEQGPSHGCGSCVTSALGRQRFPDQVLTICQRKEQTTHDRTRTSQAAREKQWGVQRGRKGRIHG